MNLTRAALRYNRITLVALLVVLIAGLLAYKGLPRSEDPGFIVRTAVVQTAFPGANPQRVEQLVTDPLEESIQKIPQLDALRSESKPGLSVIYVDILESYTHMRPIWDNLRRKVKAVTPDLPAGAQQPVVNDEFGDVFGTLIALSGDGVAMSRLEDIAEDCRTELLRSPHIAKVHIDGRQPERIYLEYQPRQLAKYGLSAAGLGRILQEHNILQPGGRFYTRQETIIIEPSGNYPDLQSLRRTPVPLPGQEQMRLGDVVSVRRGYEQPPREKIHYTGRDALVLAVHLRQGGNILALGEAVDRQLERFRDTYADKVHFDTVVFQPRFVQQKIDQFVSNLLQAVAIVLLVMLFFLGLRTGWIVAALIPMAMIATFIVMQALNMSLDQMSLASLIISLGILVDNGVVMAESILVEGEAGASLEEAAVRSVSELRLPLLISSLTTAAAFLPIFLAESNTGEYTAPLFKVVTATLLNSWLLSLTMTPLLCVHFLRPQRRRWGDRWLAPAFQRLQAGYRVLLLQALRHWGLTLGITLLLFVAGIYGLSRVPKMFFPRNDKPLFFAELRLPMGTPLARTEAVVQRIEQFAAEELMASPPQPGLRNWLSFIGSGAPRYTLPYAPEAPSSEYAYLLFNASSRQAYVEHIIPRLQAFCRQQFPELNSRIRPLFLGPPVNYPVEVRISGPDLQRLSVLAEEVQRHMEKQPHLRQVRDNWGTWSKKWRIQVDAARAARAGVTHADVARALQTHFSGLPLTVFREGDERIPVVLQAQEAYRRDPEQLAGLPVASADGQQTVPLEQIANIGLQWQPAKIRRRDTRRTITVQALVADNANAIAEAEKIKQWLTETSSDWPYTYHFSMGGEYETSGEANASIMVKLPVAGLLILLLLVWQFNSIRRTLIVLWTIPLGLIGVTAGLLWADSYFGFMTLLGVISLSGIVINNAVVLLDRIRIEQQEYSHPPLEAIVQAGQRRLRPILITTITTSGGMLPLWWGGGPMWQPLAIAIIFGLLFATGLTLLVVPVLYRLLLRVPV